MAPAADPRSALVSGRRPVRLVLTGSESTGKTTLASALAAHYAVPRSAEYVREFVERHRAPPSWRDHASIARGQMAREDAAITEAAATGAAYVVHDTDLASTVAYALHYYGRTPAWLRAEARVRRADLYLLCAPDVPWVPDGVRDRPAEREVLHGLFTDVLRELAANVVEVRGEGEARLAAAIEAIEAINAAGASPHRPTHASAAAGDRDRERHR